MRTRTEISNEYSEAYIQSKSDFIDTQLILEVLLDIRELLASNVETTPNTTTDVSSSPKI